MDQAEARRRMVDGQLRPNRVTDPRLLDAMLRLPRERYVPAGLAARAMADEDLPLGQGRVLLQPMTLARLVQLAAVRTGERVLVAASGTGYGAAVLAAMGAVVVAVEADPRLLAVAAANPGPVRQERGPPDAGWPVAAPFDAILIEGAVPAVPEALWRQLAEGGRLVTVLRGPGRPGAAVLGTRTGDAFATVEAFDCRTASLPGFAPEPGFVFA